LAVAATRGRAAGPATLAGNRWPVEPTRPAGEPVPVAPTRRLPIPLPMLWPASRNGWQIPGFNFGFRF